MTCFQTERLVWRDVGDYAFSQVISKKGEVFMGTPFVV